MGVTDDRRGLRDKRADSERGAKAASKSVKAWFRTIRHKKDFEDSRRQNKKVEIAER